MPTILLLVTLLWLGVAGGSYPLAAPSPISIQVRPRIGMAPVEVSILIRIVPSDQNRALCLLWGIEWEDMRSSSCRDLDGIAAPAVFQYWRTIREGGTWTFIARIQRADGSRSSVHETIEIRGRG